MLILHKILPVFALPLGVVTLLLCYALIARKRWPVGLALVILYFASTPLVGNRLIGWLESRHPPVAVAHVENADAVVVLGGIFGPPVAAGFLPNVSDSGERLEAGIVLMQANKALWLVFTGGKLPWEGRAALEGEEAREQAITRGIPLAQILVTREVGNTADEAQAVAGLMTERGWRRIILVTTGWHMPRAVRLFRKARVECVIFPVDFRRDVRRPLNFLDFVPCADGLGSTETALREFYGYAFYAVTGR